MDLGRIVGTYIDIFNIGSPAHEFWRYVDHDEVFTEIEVEVEEVIRRALR